MTTVPNQRTITVKKEKTDKQHRYTANNLAALDEAARLLQSKGGFKLYMYLAKNQDKYQFALSSADFCAWSGLGMTAYNSAFQELKDKGYLVLKDDSKQGKNHFVFYDKSMLAEQEEETIIEIPVEKVEQQNNIRQLIDTGKQNDHFVF